MFADFFYSCSLLASGWRQFIYYLISQHICVFVIRDPDYMCRPARRRLPAAARAVSGRRVVCITSERRARPPASRRILPQSAVRRFTSRRAAPRRAALYFAAVDRAPGRTCAESALRRGSADRAANSCRGRSASFGVLR